MNGDLVALGLALVLGAVVVILGLRRNLSETTRDGIPRFQGDPEGATATVGLYEGEERRRRPLTPRQQRWLASLYLLMALFQAAAAVLSPLDKPIHAAAAAVMGLAAVVLLVRLRSAPPRRGSAL